MQPSAAKECGVTDLLERILDKGLVLHADLIISLAGVPLLGVSLKAAIAGMETMLKYGMLTDMDEKTREWARKEKERRKPKEPLAKGEQVLLKMFGSHWYSGGIYHNWRPGHFYVTDRRIFLWRTQPAELLLDIPYELIKGISIERKQNVAREEVDYLYILLKNGEIVQLHPTDVVTVRKVIEKRMKELGLKLIKKPIVPSINKETAIFLTPGEIITHSGKMWYLMSLPSSGRTTRDEWKPGHLYLTNKRLYWYDSFDGKIAWETARDSLIHATTQLKDLGNMLKNKEILSVLYRTRQGNKVACFSGLQTELEDWGNAFDYIIRQRSEPLPEDWETCPQCGEKAPRERLLKKGCSVCGWISPKLKRKV